MKVKDFSRNNEGIAASRLFGVEIEAEGGRIEKDFPLVSMWRLDHDGSLRNRGVEFISRPMPIGALDKAVTAIYKYMRQTGFSGNVRTGIHVHANVLDFDVTEVVSTLITYCILEPVLFRMCGDEREEGTYCVPWYRAPDQVELVTDLLNGNHDAVRESCKYSALYIEPLYRFGTLEFRHAPTYSTSKETMLWIRLINMLLDYGKRNSPQTVLNTFEEVGAHRFLHLVFGKYARHVLDVCDEPVEDIIEAVESFSVAESILPCTYKADWSILLEDDDDGEGAVVNYHQRVNAPRRIRTAAPNFTGELGIVFDDLSTEEAW